jgi:hypothetical protein
MSKKNLRAREETGQGKVEKHLHAQPTKQKKYARAQVLLSC